MVEKQKMVSPADVYYFFNYDSNVQKFLRSNDDLGLT